MSYRRLGGWVMDERTTATEGFHDAWRAMVQQFPGHTWDRDGAVVTATTGLPVAPFNGVWVAAEEPDTAAVLSAADRFAAGELPWNLQVRGAAPADLAGALTERGLVRTAAVPLMVARPDEVRARGQELEWSEVVTFEDVDHELRLLELGFGMPEDLTRRGFPMTVFATPGMSAWLGRSAGDVVTTGTVLLVDGSAGLFNIATPEQHRGKGYGSAVTTHLVRVGAERGAPLAWLQASPMGEPVYRALGFRTVESWEQWMPRAYVD